MSLSPATKSCISCFVWTQRALFITLCLPLQSFLQNAQELSGVLCKRHAQTNRNIVIIPAFFCSFLIVIHIITYTYYWQYNICYTLVIRNIFQTNFIYLLLIIYILIKQMWKSGNSFFYLVVCKSSITEYECFIREFVRLFKKEGWKRHYFYSGLICWFLSSCSVFSVLKVTKRCVPPLSPCIVNRFANGRLFRADIKISCFSLYIFLKELTYLIACPSLISSATANCSAREARQL